MTAQAPQHPNSDDRCLCWHNFKEHGDGSLGDLSCQHEIPTRGRCRCPDFICSHYSEYVRSTPDPNGNSPEGIAARRADAHLTEAILAVWRLTDEQCQQVMAPVWGYKTAAIFHTKLLTAFRENGKPRVMIQVDT